MKSIIIVGTKNASKEISGLKEFFIFNRSKALIYIAALLWKQGKKRYK